MSVVSANVVRPRTSLAATNPSHAAEIINGAITLNETANHAHRAYLVDATEEWVTLKLPRDEAVAYLKFEILEWFKERGIHPDANDVRLVTALICQRARN